MERHRRYIHVAHLFNHIYFRVDSLLLENLYYYTDTKSKIINE